MVLSRACPRSSSPIRSGSKYPDPGAIAAAAKFANSPRPLRGASAVAKPKRLNEDGGEKQDQDDEKVVQSVQGSSLARTEDGTRRASPTIRPIAIATDERD